MRLTLNTAPAAEPLTLAEAKAHAHIEINDDALIQSLIGAARRHAEHVTRRALVTQTWDLKLDRFPRTIVVPRPPLQSITSITYVDPDGATQTLASSVYTVDTDSEPGTVYEAYDQNWPSIRHIPAAITVRFKAGYGNAAAVPADIRLAMNLMVAHWYENREATLVNGTAIELPLAVDALLYPYRVWTF